MKHCYCVFFGGGAHCYQGLFQTLGSTLWTSWALGIIGMCHWMQLLKQLNHRFGDIKPWYIFIHNRDEEFVMTIIIVLKNGKLQVEVKWPWPQYCPLLWASKVDSSTTRRHILKISRWFPIPARPLAPILPLFPLSCVTDAQKFIFFA